MTARVHLCALLALLALTSVARSDDAVPAADPQAEESSLKRVVVTAQRLPQQDYRAPSLDSLGPLGTTPVLDTPYTIGILTHDMIENSQAVDFRDVSKYLPLVAYQEQQGPDILRPQTRGMQGGNFQNTRLDGMTMFITVANAMEQFQQIEVLNGLSSSLYGPANPAGMFNFISKRPTDYDLREVTASYSSDGIGTAKVDLGGRIDAGGMFSYRLNALYGEGDAYVEHSHQRRALGDLGVDIRPWQHGVLELNYSSYSLDDSGYPGWFTYNEKTILPPAPDPTRVGYGQSYAGVDLSTQIATARFKQEFASGWKLVAGVLSQDAARDINTPVNNLNANNSGAYTSSFANGFAPRFVITSDVAYLNNSFTAFGVGNDLTLGTAGYKARTFVPLTRASAASVLLGNASIADPAIYPEPPQGPPDTLINYDSSDNYQQGVNVGDTLRFSERWLARLGASQDWFSTDNYNTRRVRTSEYSEHGLSPTASLMYKPRADMTAYVTWASSLQTGDLAPAGTVNAGQSLAPYRSTEYEIGYKASLAAIDLGAALFRIERPFANIDPIDNVFKITGDQVNKGLELSAVGHLTESLMLFGGVTYLDARMEHTPLASTNDQLYVGAPKLKGNALLEYQIKGLAGLVATFDWQFSSERAGNDTNSLMVAGYNLFDIGLRYVADRVTVRLAVDNVTHRYYWSTVAPSNLTGANTGSLIGHLGTPRTVLASVSVFL
ncbi:MAG TPA: TonB-dependent siderophore receptor [Steroidobacteraceae bacterium]|nr:TonB-dependent siderophore receptor [Steroidobacteraceae bacterium]